MNQFTRILPALNFTADSCNIAFCKDRREVMLHITDASGAASEFPTGLQRV